MFILSTKTYEFFKKLVQIGLPACGSLYFSLSAVWGLPYADEVVGTLAIVSTFLGTVLMISSKTYKALEPDHDGEMVIEHTEDGRVIYALQLNGDPEKLSESGSVSFKVVHRDNE